MDHRVEGAGPAPPWPLRWSRVSSGSRRVLPLIGLLLAVSVATWVLDVRGQAPIAQDIRIPWWLLTLMFGVGEIFVLHIQVKREAQTVSLSEIPLVLGLFFATPVSLLLGWLVGPFLVFALHRRQAPIKILYNTALLAAQASVSLAVFHLLLGREADLGPRLWLATLATVAVSGALAAAATTVAIALYEQSFRPRELVTETASGAAMSMAVGVVALVATYALSHSVIAVGPLLASVAILLLGYRTYASLSERHLSLERLYRFSQVVSSTLELDEVLRSVLVEAKELLRAEQAEVTFAPGHEGATRVRVTLGPDNSLERSDYPPVEGSDWVWARVLEQAAPVLLPRGTKDQRQRRYLAARQLREAIVAPLRGEGGVVGTIAVNNRMGDVRGFDGDDVRLLETVTNHAGVALQNGRLIGQLRYEALHDSLTGLPNRTLLLRRLQEVLDALRAGQIAGCAVIIMDLDGFKEINDTLGHPYGDVLLCQVAGRMASIGGPAATVARLGGDEFAVLLPDVVQPEEAATAAWQLQGVLEQPVGMDYLDVQLGASIGIALAPAHGTDISALLKRADIAMYSAKASGRGIWVYEPSLDRRGSPRRLALLSDLRQAIQLDQLGIHVQPKASMATGKVNGVEALVRWHHPRYGTLHPDEFVPIAERSGLVRQLTMAVMEQALAACAEWRSQGRELGVAVNLSTRSLVDFDLASDVGGLLRQSGVPPHLLTLEITESSIMTDPTRTIDLLLRLSEMGVRLSIDDFGTGYSSLSYLTRLPVDEVKIDKSFVARMDTDDAAVVRSIVELVGNLSLVTVAEGVEDQPTWSRLRAMGCDMAQGYYLARPIPVDELPGWLGRYEQPAHQAR